MKAVVVVAHPDDCLIFARPYIDAHPTYDWSIVYLTYSSTDERAKEMSLYWNNRNIPTTFLGFIDDYRDIENETLSFSVEDATQAILSTVDGDIILTHNDDGEYGHIHHKFVNAVVNQIDKPKVYFANTAHYNIQYTAISSLTFDDFPLHKEVLQMFDELDIGRYRN